jgi:hypothetical protein
MTLIDVIYDLTECTKRSVNLIVEQRRNRQYEDVQEAFL